MVRKINYETLNEYWTEFVDSIKGVGRLDYEEAAGYVHEAIVDLLDGIGHEFKKVFDGKEKEDV